MSYEKDWEKFRACCTKCGGVCCKGGSEYIIPISSKEKKFLKKKLPDLEIKKASYGEGIMDYFKVPKSGCPFLNGLCVLGDKKPINCIMYPLVFIYEKGKITYYFDDMKNQCPYIKELQGLKDWANETIKVIDVEIQKWSEKEKIYFSSLAEGSSLIKI